MNTPFQMCWESGTDFFEMGSLNLLHIREYKDQIASGENPEAMRVSDGMGTTVGWIPAERVNELIEGR